MITVIIHNVCRHRHFVLFALVLSLPTQAGYFLGKSYGGGSFTNGQEGAWGRYTRYQDERSFSLGGTASVLNSDQSWERSELFRQEGRDHHYFEISDLTRLRRFLQDEDFAYVMFHDPMPGLPGIRQQITQRAFRRMAKGPVYRDRGVNFATINVSSAPLMTYARNLGIRSFPAFVLFRRGRGGAPPRPVVNNKGAVILREGHLDRNAMVAHIDRTIGHTLERSRRKQPVRQCSRGCRPCAMRPSCSCSCRQPRTDCPTSGGGCSQSQSSNQGYANGSQGGQVSGGCGGQQGCPYYNNNSRGSVGYLGPVNRGGRGYVRGGIGLSIGR